MDIVLTEMNNLEIITSISEAGYPSNVTDAEIAEGINFVLRELKFKWPLMMLGSFMTVACQQEYDLFNEVPFTTKSQGVFPGGLRVYEVVWSPDGDLSNPNDVFGIAPWLQGWGDTFLGGWGRYSFFTPGDWVIWDLDWAALKGRFAPNDFEHVNDSNGSPIKLYPTPKSVEPVLCRFTKARTPDDLRNEDEAWFLLLVEARVARILSRKFALCSGISFGDITKDAGNNAKFWEREAQRLWEEGWALFERNRHEQISSAMRSNLP